ncbi:MAG: indole-3-glycerol phosphate synthase TrpC [Spirochaetales bacterium]|nr:indole-3-glycerol phosphate synthase TrpC [Spirochaetales bacterium]
MPADAGVLAPILAAKQKEVAELARRSSPELTLAAHRFRPAVKRPAGSPVRVIAECKKASPSKGLLRNHYEPVALAREYKQLGAAALSILTDQNFFQGSLTDLTAVLPVGLPVLRKDFIIDERQIFQARAAGADAILLIVRILSTQQLRDFFEIVTGLGMDALIEVHDQPELEAALEVGADMIGINHRNLDTLMMDLSLTSRLAPVARAARPELVLVAESGVEDRAGIDAVDAHADAVLIGTAFMQARSISAVWKELFV